MANDDIKSMIKPSAKTMLATFDEIHESTTHIKSDIESVVDTLKVIDETLGVFTNSANLSASIGVFNPIAWSIPTTVKLATGVISRYITNKTDISFVGWVEFIKSVLEQFEDYANQLDKIAKLSSKYNGEFSNSKNFETQEFNNDESVLIDIKSKTKTWKGLIKKMSELSVVIDAILDARKETIKEATGDNNLNTAINSDIKKMFGAVTDKINLATENKSKELQEQLVKWMFSSIRDLKDRTKEFGNQTKALLSNISTLETLLELEIAQIQACSGKIPLQEIEILSTRVVANITVPQLKNRIAKLKQDIAHYKNILDNLHTEYKKNRINDKIYQALQIEYNTGLHTSIALLKQTEIQADIWKTKGIPLLEEGINWTNAELEIIRARNLVGQITLEELKQKSKYLNKEILQLEEAKNILISLEIQTQ